MQQRITVEQFQVGFAVDVCSPPLPGLFHRQIRAAESLYQAQARTWAGSRGRPHAPDPPRTPARAGEHRAGCDMFPAIGVPGASASVPGRNSVASILRYPL
jgi:hypothetical protein